ncbi:MAG: hypothetical protein RLY86_1523 [Pseudomonadota bacterium]|jgi:endonuclease YncB( thermonuclease family)
MRRRPFLLLIVAILVAPLTVAWAAGAWAAGVPAGLTPAGDGMVATVQDALTLTLDDGRTVRLTGLTGPAADGNAADGGEGMQILASLVRGERVLLYFAGRAQDRYGRVLAHLVRERDGLWVQGELLRRGLARMETWADARGAAAALRRAEREGRSAGAGLWGAPDGQPRDAGRSPRDWVADFGRFHLVRGKVLTATKARDRVYLNFGGEWRSDFTVEIENRDLRLFDGALDPLKLAGKVVEVRGWVEEAGGPAIRVTHPEQIEVMEP